VSTMSHAVTKTRTTENLQRVLSVLGILLLSIGCGSDRTEVREEGTTPGIVSIVPGEMPGEEEKAKMLAAKEALFTRLSGRLMEVMGSQGPSAAIEVCQQEAPQIAVSVSEEQGLRIGRTGVRLRNAANVSPSWAESLVNQRIDTPTFAVLDNGASVALLPIKLQGQCLMCHGPQEEIPAEVQERLAALYPNDEATGFQEGELRGWFWIELPAATL
jgi:hypothetical protein